LDVFGAYFQKGTPTCGTAPYTSYNAGGLLSVVDINISNPGNAIDANAGTHSSLSLGVLGAGEWIEQTVYFEGASSTTDTYNLKVSIPPALLAANLINGITVAAYNGTSTTPVGIGSTNLSSLLGLPVNAQVLGLLQNNQPAILSFTPGAAANRITLRYQALVAVNTNYNVFLYEVTKGFGLNVTGAGTYHVGNTVNLTANLVPEQCSATYSYSWVATGTSTVLGTGATYTPSTNTPGTYNYTVTVTDSFGVVKTAQAQVIVQVPPVAGSLNNIILYCTDTPSTNLTLTGNTGSVVRWEKADNSNFTNKVNIAVTNTFLTPAQIGTVTLPTYFRAVVTQNNYPEVVTTTGGLVAPKISTWDGTAWSNGTPDIGTIIYFTGNFTATANLDGCRIIVSNNAVVNIPSTFTVHLNKSINVQSGSFTLQDNAHLIQDTSAEANLGNITVVKNSSNLFKLDYTLWSAPVTGQNLKAFSPATMNNRFYYYEYLPANSAEVYIPIDPLTNNFDVARAYLIRMPDTNPASGYDGGTTAITFTGQFTGVPNNGTITKTLSTVNNRFTAVGNPYPSPISVLDFYAANASVLKTGSALYFWRKKNNTNASSYATLTTDLYTYNHATGGNAGEGQYGGMQWDQYFNGSNPSTWVINPGQGFFVKTKDELAAGSNPQLTFNTTMRRGNAHNTQFFRTANTTTDEEEGLKSRMWIDMTGANDAFSQAALVYSSTATMALDYGRDAESFSSGSTVALWSTAENTKLVVQARPAFTMADVVPMGYRADTPGQYTFALHASDGVFGQGQDIYLKDNMLGTTMNLSDAAYTFTTEAGTFAGRFEIVYTQSQLGIGEAELTNGSVIVYQQNNAINISCDLATITDVAVYDVRGRKLYTANNISANETSITSLAVQQQVLIIEVTTEKGKVSKKIVY
ncbi:MAG: T9SS type A sorting domain-containing protein, partial [Sphingobacteriales bacterium]